MEKWIEGGLCYGSVLGSSVLQLFLPPPILFQRILSLFWLYSPTPAYDRCLNVNFNSTTDKSFADKRERGCSLFEEVMLVPGRVPWVPVGS